MMKLYKLLSYTALAGMLLLLSCDKFDEFNQNPNEPTSVSSDVLLTSAIRSSMNTMVTESFLLGNNAAQLTAKTLRTEVDAYNWNAFPTVWDGLYESLTDVYAVEEIALENGNENLQGVAIVLRSWIFSTLTNAYGDIPYFGAIQGKDNNFTPVYDAQPDIYADLLDQLAKADGLLASGNGSISGDILLNGDASKWRKLANSLRLRLLMTAGNQLADAGARFAAIADAGNIMSSNEDNATLTYLSGFPNQYPLVPLKTGDFDAVAFSKTAYEAMNAYGDPRLLRYARPDNDEYNANATFSGAVNGSNTSSCPKTGSRLGAQYFNDPAQTTAAELGLPMAEGILMTYAEVEFLLAEAAAKGWITDDVEAHYRSGIEASMAYHMAGPEPFGWSSFSDFYENSGVAYDKVTDIWEQKWLALFFHGLEPYFEVRRWYFESGMSWDGIPFMGPACENLNEDDLPLRFLYPGEEQSLNAENYQAAVGRLGGSNSQNAAIWLVQ
ncbi:MAG: SusD/RagB family nutrient-binding outer membrane lipoprotein [Phaeodactylibacter sp.]|nr:SusD/RagB family nutrient-binding outer membrane lipoprotein [Phaeodactylibacter sp.]MCB9264859.1 SusD/RagB family nutrient-binding outer membrane lipoprotein [Lewinellaceae bacterium]